MSGIFWSLINSVFCCNPFVFWTIFLVGILRVLYFIYLGHKFKNLTDITAWGSSSWKLCDSICPCPGMLIYFGCLSSVGWYLCLSNKVDWYILIKHQKCGLSVIEVGENCGRVHDGCPTFSSAFLFYWNGGSINVLLLLTTPLCSWKAHINL